MQKSNILGLRTTIYTVADLQKAKDWYAKAFGAPPYFDESYYVGFSVGGFELGLQPEATPVKEKTANVIAYWGVEDIRASYAHFLTIGAKEREAPFTVGGPIETATVIDPFGNVIGLIYNPIFSCEK